MSDPQDLIAQARTEYNRVQDAELDNGPLAGMPLWISRGEPPSAVELRAAGLTCEGRDEATSVSLRLARKAFTRRWGFSIPCREAVETLRDLGPLVEVGAGTGYWSSLLQGAGCDIIATDPAPRANPHGFETGRYTGISPLSATDAIEGYGDRSVFCSWPTQGEAWAAEAFALIHPGLRLALIGTERGGLTGSTDLFDLLDAGFAVEREVAIPLFPQVNDRLVVYRKTRNGEAVQR
jgi:hypothetical protein